MTIFRHFCRILYGALIVSFGVVFDAYSLFFNPPMCSIPSNITQAPSGYAIEISPLMRSAICNTDTQQGDGYDANAYGVAGYCHLVSNSFYYKRNGWYYDISANYSGNYACADNIFSQGNMCLTYDSGSNTCVVDKSTTINNALNALDSIYFLNIFPSIGAPNYNGYYCSYSAGALDGDGKTCNKFDDGYFAAHFNSVGNNFSSGSTYAAYSVRGISRCSVSTAPGNSGQTGLNYVNINYGDDLVYNYNNNNYSGWTLFTRFEEPIKVNVAQTNSSAAHCWCHITELLADDNNTNLGVIYPAVYGNAYTMLNNSTGNPLVSGYAINFDMNSLSNPSYGYYKLPWVYVDTMPYSACEDSCDLYCAKAVLGTKTSTGGTARQAMFRGAYYRKQYNVSFVCGSNGNEASNGYLSAKNKTVGYQSDFTDPNSATNNQCGGTDGNGSSQCCTVTDNTYALDSTQPWKCYTNYGLSGETDVTSSLTGGYYNIAGDVTCVANIYQPTYTVTYNKNDGTSTSVSANYVEGASMEVPSTAQNWAMSRSGFVLDGWDCNNNNVTYSTYWCNPNNNCPTMPPTPVTCDARWKKIHTVKYYCNCNDATGTDCTLTATDSHEYLDGDQINVGILTYNSYTQVSSSCTTPPSNDVKFGGWTCNRNGTDVNFASINEYLTTNINDDNPIICRGRWVPKLFVYYYCDNDQTSDYTDTNGNTNGYRSGYSAIVGYSAYPTTFIDCNNDTNINWVCAVNGGTNQTFVHNDSSNNSFFITAPTSCYAQYRITYTDSTNNCNDTSNVGPTSYTANDTSVGNLSACSYSSSGQTFSGWECTSYGWNSAQTVTAGSTFNTLPYANITCDAQFTTLTNTITYHCNATGTGQTVTYNRASNVTVGRDANNAQIQCNNSNQTNWVCRIANTNNSLSLTQNINGISNDYDCYAQYGITYYATSGGTTLSGYSPSTFNAKNTSAINLPSYNGNLATNEVFQGWNCSNTTVNWSQNTTATSSNGGNLNNTSPNTLPYSNINCVAKIATRIAFSCSNSNQATGTLSSLNNNNSYTYIDNGSSTTVNLSSDTTIGNTISSNCSSNPAYAYEYSDFACNWAMRSGASSAKDMQKGSSADLQCWGTWTAKSYNITYSCGTGGTSGNGLTNGNFSYTSQTANILSNDSSVCSRPGYTFDTWNCTDNTSLNQGTNVNMYNTFGLQHVNCSPDWKQVYYLTYSCGNDFTGGTAPSSQAYTQNGPGFRMAQTNTAGICQRTGYEYTQWECDNNTTYNGNQNIGSPYMTFGTGATCEPKWTNETIHLTLNPGSYQNICDLVGAGSLGNGDMTFTYQQTQTLTDVWSVYHTGCELTGWTCDNSNYYNSTTKEYTMNSTAANQSCTANWAKQYTITYTCGSALGVTGNAPNLQTYKQTDSSVTMASTTNTCERDGDGFTQWKCGSNNVSGTVNNPYPVFNGDITCEPNWVTITYKSSCPTRSEITGHTVNVKSGTTNVTLSDNTNGFNTCPCYDDNNYTWSCKKTSDNTAVSVNNNATITMPGYDITCTKTFNTQETYTITYLNNNASGTVNGAPLPSGLLGSGIDSFTYTDLYNVCYDSVNYENSYLFRFNNDQRIMQWCLVPANDNYMDTNCDGYINTGLSNYVADYQPLNCNNVTNLCKNITVYPEWNWFYVYYKNHNGSGLTEIYTLNNTYQLYNYCDGTWDNECDYTGDKTSVSLFSSPGYSNSGWSFAGWSCAERGSNGQNVSNTEFTVPNNNSWAIPSNKLYKAINCTARWSKNVDVKYYCDSTLGIQVGSTQSVPVYTDTTGTTTTLTQSDATNGCSSYSAYTFGGWNCGGTSVNADTSMSVSDSVNCYAVWNGNTTNVTLTYSCGAGSGNGPGTVSGSFTAPATYYQVTLASDPTSGTSTCTAPTNQTFASWQCGDTTYNAGASYNLSADTTCTAQWECPAGYYIYNNTCTPCPIGTYSTNVNSGTCTLCNNGQTTSAAGQTSCQACSNANDSHIAQSNAWATPTWSNGQNAVSGLCVITNCQNGYAPNPANTSDNSCNAVKYKMTYKSGGVSGLSDVERNDALQVDTPYTLEPVSNLWVAQTSRELTGWTCTYSGGNITPSQSNGTYTIAGNQIPSADVECTATWQCNAGYYGNGTSCSPCPAGSYNNNTGSSTCTPCSAGTTTTTTGNTSSSNCSSCSNNANVASTNGWGTPTWNNGSIDDICTITSCETGYQLTGSGSNTQCQMNTYNVVYDCGTGASGTPPTDNNTYNFTSGYNTVTVLGNNESTPCSMSGSAFQNWDCTGFGAKNPNDTFTIIATSPTTITCTAQWSGRYNIKYISYSGTGGSQISLNPNNYVASDTEIDLPDTTLPTYNRSGYAFAGWSCVANGNDLTVSNTNGDYQIIFDSSQANPASEITCTANWMPTQCSVVYRAGTGAGAPTQTQTVNVNNGTATATLIDKPDGFTINYSTNNDSTPSGFHKFWGWECDGDTVSSCNGARAPETTISLTAVQNTACTTTCTAYWDRVARSVTFKDTNTNTGNTSTLMIGFKDTCARGQLMNSTDINNYNITESNFFTSNVCQSDSSNMTNQSMDPNTVKCPTPVWTKRNGYVLDGWSCDNGVTVTTTTNNNEKSFHISTMPNEDITCTANWSCDTGYLTSGSGDNLACTLGTTSVTYTVSDDCKKSGDTYSDSDNNISYGSSYTFKSYDNNKSTWESHLNDTCRAKCFHDWDCGTNHYDQRQTVNPYNSMSNITCTPYFTDCNALTVEYYVDNVKDNSLTQQFTVQTSVNILGTYTKNGYNCTPWKYQNGTSAPANTSGLSESIRLYTTCTATQYNITYRDASTTLTTDTYTVKDLPFSLWTGATKTGYTFVEWYGNEQLTGEPVSVIPTGSTGDKTFWAKWTPKTTSVVYNCNGGTGRRTDTATFDSPFTFATVSSVCTRTGYEPVSAKSWNCTNNVSAQDTEHWNYDVATTTCSAQWSGSNYNIIYVCDSGTGYGSTVSIQYNTNVTLNTTGFDCAKDQYTFSSWQCDNNIVNGSVYKVDGNTTCRAQYTRSRCNDGQYLTDDGKCVNCAVGTYSDDGKTCKVCGRGFTTTSSGSTSSAECKNCPNNNGSDLVQGFVMPQWFKSTNTVTGLCEIGECTTGYEPKENPVDDILRANPYEYAYTSNDGSKKRTLNDGSSVDNGFWSANFYYGNITGKTHCEYLKPRECRCQATEYTPVDGDNQDIQNITDVVYMGKYSGSVCERDCAEICIDNVRSGNKIDFRESLYGVLFPRGQVCLPKKYKITYRTGIAGERTTGFYGTMDYTSVFFKERNVQLDYNKYGIDGYDFDEWQCTTINTNGESVTLNLSDGEIIEQYIYPDNLLCTAQWTPKKYDIIYRPGRFGTGEAYRDEDVLAYDIETNYDLLPNTQGTNITPIEGYRFIGWNTDRYASVPMTSYGTYRFLNDLTVYAIYDKIPKCEAGQYLDTTDYECKSCGVGTFSIAGENVCSPCPAGSYNDEIGAGVCQLCKAGTYSESGAESCSSCQDGYYTSDDGASQCDICPAGTHSNPTHTNCEICQANTYSEDGAATCDSCPNDYPYSNAGSESMGACYKKINCPSEVPANDCIVEHAICTYDNKTKTPGKEYYNNSQELEPANCPIKITGCEPPYDNLQRLGDGTYKCVDTDMYSITYTCEDDSSVVEQIYDEDVVALRMDICPKTNQELVGWTCTSASDETVNDGDVYSVHGNTTCTNPEYRITQCEANKYLSGNECLDCASMPDITNGNCTRNHNNTLNNCEYTCVCEAGYEFDSEKEQCVAIQYSIKYNNGETTTDTYTVENEVFELPTPEKDNYTFEGWYDNANFTGNIVTEFDTDDKEPKNFYAKWSFDCPSNKWLHIGEEKMCLTTQAIGKPRIVVMIGDTQHYIPLTKRNLPIHDGAHSKWRIRIGNQTFNAHDLSVEY